MSGVYVPPRRGKAAKSSRQPGVRASLRTMVEWYATHVYGQLEGAGTVPFYCDAARVGRFAVDPASLARGDEAALFGLFVALTMYQSRRDVDIMQKQREMPARAATALVDPRRVQRAVAQSPCERLRDAATFDATCDVRRTFVRDGATRDAATCNHRPRTPCHVKDASLAIGRMGDLGKMATSAWLHLQTLPTAVTPIGDFVVAATLPTRAADLAPTGNGYAAMLRKVLPSPGRNPALPQAGFAALFAAICRRYAAPAQRAAEMVAAVATFYHVGEKLASMFVAALSTPALAPGLTPWFPALDGNSLLVIDTNVARVLDVLRPSGTNTYAARSAWLRKHAATIDLSTVRSDWPAHSPRLMQQASYWYRSRSNREVAGLGCTHAAPDAALPHFCVLRICPFVNSSRGR